MTIPKQDERAPGPCLLPVRLAQPWAGFSRLDIGPYKIGIAITDEDGAQDPEAAGAALGSWVQACNAYTSTDALRSALAPFAELYETYKGYSFARVPIEDCRNAFAALSGSPAPSTEGLREWQPIETAPKDGTGFLYFAPAGLGHRIIDAGYFDGHTFRAVNFYGDDDPTIEPTHWMPLPLPPDAARTALAGVTAPQEVTE